MSYSLDDLQKTGFLTPYIRWKEEMGYKDTDDKLEEFLNTHKTEIKEKMDEFFNSSIDNGDKSDENSKNTSLNDIPEDKREDVKDKLKDYQYDDDGKYFRYTGKEANRQGDTVAFRHNIENRSYSLVTKDKDGKPRPAREDEVKAFVATLPKNMKFQLVETLPPSTQALLVKHIGKDRIKDCDAVMNRLSPELRDIATGKTSPAQPTAELGSVPREQEQQQVEQPKSTSGNEHPVEQPEPTRGNEQPVRSTAERVQSDSTPKPVETPEKGDKKKKVIYNEDDLTQSAKNDYENWKPKKGQKTVNDFLAKAGYKYRETVADIKEKGPHNCRNALKLAIAQKKADKKEYKMTEGLVNDLLVAHKGAEFQPMRRNELTNKDKLVSQINFLEKNNPEKFAKYRRMYEEKYISGKSDKVKGGYNNKTYEERTEILKNLMVTDLLSKKDGYLKSDVKKDKPSWRKNYRKIRDEERPIRKAMRKERRRNAWKKVTEPFVKLGKGIKSAPGKVRDYIKGIPGRIKDAKINRLNKRIDKKLEGKTVDQLSQQKIKQILRLQGRLDMRKDNQKVGFGERRDIRNQVRGTSEEQRKEDLQMIIDKRQQTR